MMTAERAIEIGEAMKQLFEPRRKAIDACRRYGYQMRRNGEPAWENAKDDTLEPLQTSFAASRAWRLAMYIHANTIGIGNTFFYLDAREGAETEYLGQRAVDMVSSASDKVMRALMDTNFSSAAASAFNDVAVVGTAITYVEFDEKKKRFRFQNFRVGDGSYYDQDSKGNPDQFCRFYHLSAKQAWQEFGEACSPQIQQALSRPNEVSKQFEFVWLVYPRDSVGERFVGNPLELKDKREKAWGSIIVEVGTKTIVRYGGFDDFPFAVLCWQQKDGRPYGWSPIEMSLPDIIYMSEMRFDTNKAIKKQVNPPIAVPATWEGVDMSEGAVNLVDAQTDLRDRIAVLPSPANLQNMEATIQDCQRNINYNLMLDAFEALNDGTNYMSATETRARVSQAVRAIAPVITSVHYNYFSPLIRLAYQILVQRGDIQFPKGEVDIRKVGVKYISVIDSMLLQGQASQLLEFVSAIMNITQAWAGLGDYINCFVDFGKIIKHFADKYHVPAGVLYDEDTAKENMQALKQAQQEAQEAVNQQAYVKPIDPQKKPEDGSMASRSNNLYGV